MSQCSDGLHLNGVTLIERVVEDTWRVDDLPAGVLVVSVAHEEVLCSEGVWLHVHIGVGNIIDEARLADIREAGDDESTRVRVDCGQTRQMLPDLLEVAQGRLQFFEKGAGATQSCSFQLFGAVKRVGVLE